MRSKHEAARGAPLAVLLGVLLMLLTGIGVLAGSGFVEVEQVLVPDDIFVAGMGAEPATAELRLLLTGTLPEADVPVDCILVIDVSATATGTLTAAKELALELIDLFGEQDRVGVVSFSDRAVLDATLSMTKSQAKTAVADLEVGGKSALGEGLRVARQELLAEGRDGSLLVEIVLSDGQSNVGRTPDVEADVADEAGIMIISIGVGTLINQSLLDELAQTTGGAFYPRRSDAMLAEIEALLTVEPIVPTLVIEKWLPEPLRYLEATPLPTRVVRGSDGTLIQWQIALTERWEAVIGIAAMEEGVWETDDGSVIRAENFRGEEVVIDIEPLELKAREPLAPTAFFLAAPNEPRIGVETTFDASGTVVYQDSSIASYAWDFDGDRVIDDMTDDAVITHAFAVEGVRNVTLWVTDDEGRVGEFDREIEVFPSVSIVRTIDTCLPDDETIEGATIEVAIKIDVNTEIHGLVIHEVTPVGWIVELTENNRATPHNDSVNHAVDWLFLETLQDGDTRTIRYRLTAPTGGFTSDQNLDGYLGGRDSVTIVGLGSSSSPQFAQQLAGEDKITRVEYVSAPVAIAHWDTAQQSMDICLPAEFSFDQIQYAVSLWLSGSVVPHTGGLTVDLMLIQDLIAYWLTDTSVYDPLP
ncbi:VWA domain-containing protein [Candidatus Bipolaricaulota bacterium]|nr:VWA domain-containing protein [Candidatus Bipolaricaulota bacterium]